MTWNCSVSDSVRGSVHRNAARPSSDHARHDRLLVARFAAGDAYSTELSDARALVDGCNDCAALADEIRLLMRATAALPAPRRARDFRISAEQAEALRGSLLDRLLRRLATPSLAPLRPVAGVALSLGIVLAVAGAALPGIAPEGEIGQTLSGGEPAAPALPAPGAEQVPEPDSAPAYGDHDGRSNGAAGGPDAVDPGAVERDYMQVAEEYDVTALQAADGGTMRVLLVYGGVTLALLSFGVLLLAIIARHREGDSLIR
jgi:hypothetical protein